MAIEKPDPKTGAKIVDLFQALKDSLAGTAERGEPGPPKGEEHETSEALCKPPPKSKTS